MASNSDGLPPMGPGRVPPERMMDYLVKRMDAIEMWQRNHLVKEAWDLENRSTSDRCLFKKQHELDDAVAELKAKVTQQHESQSIFNSNIHIVHKELEVAVGELKTTVSNQSDNQFTSLHRICKQQRNLQLEVDKLRQAFTTLQGNHIQSTVAGTPLGSHNVTIAALSAAIAAQSAGLDLVDPRTIAVVMRTLEQLQIPEVARAKVRRSMETVAAGIQEIRAAIPNPLVAARAAAGPPMSPAAFLAAKARATETAAAPVGPSASADSAAGSPPPPPPSRLSAVVPPAAAAPVPASAAPLASILRDMVQAAAASAGAPPFPPDVCPKRKRVLYKSDSTDEEQCSESETEQFDGPEKERPENSETESILEAKRPVNSDDESILALSTPCVHHARWNASLDVVSSCKKLPAPPGHHHAQASAISVPMPAVKKRATPSTSASAAIVTVNAEKRPRVSLRVSKASVPPAPMATEESDEMMHAMLAAGERLHRMHADSQPAYDAVPHVPVHSEEMPRTTAPAASAHVPGHPNVPRANLRQLSHGDAGYLLDTRTCYDDNLMPEQCHTGMWRCRADKFHANHRLSQLYNADVGCNKLFRSMVPIILPNLDNLLLFMHDLKLSPYDKKRFKKGREDYEELFWQLAARTRMKFAHRSAISCKLNADYAQRYCTEADAASGSRGPLQLEELISRKAGSDCMKISSTISYSIMNNSEANSSSNSSSSD